MQGGLKNIYDCVKAFSETGFTEDLKKFDVLTLIMQAGTIRLCRSMIRRRSRPKSSAKEIYYPGLPHGLTATPADRVNADLLEFLKSIQKIRRAA
jgi:non-heme chloroperoxidase